MLLNILALSHDVGCNWTCTRFTLGSVPMILHCIGRLLRKKWTIRFLLGLNKDLDEVRGRIMEIKPFLTIREAFAEV